MNTTKQAVQLPVLEPSRHNYDRLRVCRKCGRFTILMEESCPSCGKMKLVPVIRQARVQTLRRMFNELLITLILTIAAVLISPDMRLMALFAAAGLVLLVALFLVQRRSVEGATLRELGRLFRRQRSDIYDGLVEDQRIGVEEVRSGHEVAGYHILRQTAVLVQNDRLRLALLSLLQNFRLRSDMDLELDSLITRDFDPLVAEYIGEMARIKRDRIKERSIRYIIAHEPKILQMEQGWSILVSVTSAMVRMKRYIATYPGFIRRYARHLPKERFVRLYRIVQADAELLQDALAQDLEVIRHELYPNDPELDGKGALQS
ncbi:hypothetical protein [Paenibacillus hunanensis]|uniref:Zinc ribbon domain-containing protein n=1 Tax=Paenibacillus hunanensis TaxID=539262 RepID=A0ABU1IZX2_9BACL|nr:hypothetical protein [Paenibacillus hunanensis]MDR6244810.1 hypothetical protein [Paenibacillus hunanensis]GGJ04322.1 hypothetical protein GCM10008022_11620 [Paenibacillus hunanensis]